MAKKRLIKLSERTFEEIKFIESQSKNPHFFKRIQCIKLKNEWRTHEKVSKFLDITIETVRVRIKKYTEWWIKNLLSWDYKWKIPLLSLEQLEVLKRRNKEKPFDTAKECKQFIQESFWFEYHLHSVQKILKKNFTYLSKNKK